MDNGSSNYFVYGNIIVRAGLGMILHCGKNNIIENNIFVDCDPAFRADARALDPNWAGYHADAWLAEAAAIISEHPMALQLRYLQTLREVSAENNSTTLFPIPIDLFRPFLKLQEMVEKSEKEGSST